MTDRHLRDLYRAATPAPTLDAEAEARIAAAVHGGSAADRDAGLELLARLPQGPALVRALRDIEADSEQLARELAARRRTTGSPWRRLPAALALAAGVGAVAVMVGGLGLRGSEPTPPPVAGLDAEAQVMMASFELAEPASHDIHSGSGERKVFRSNFDS